MTGWQQAALMVPLAVTALAYAGAVGVAVWLPFRGRRSTAHARTR